MVPFIQLPPEILYEALHLVDPEDILVLKRVCRHLYGFISSPLFREIYLRLLDEPPFQGLNWEREVRNLVKLRKICQDKSESKADQLHVVHDLIIDLLNKSVSSGARSSRSSTYAHSLNAAELIRLFEAEENRNAFLCRSFIFERARGETHAIVSPAKTLEQRRQSAKLHSLYGAMLLKHGRTRSTRIYPYACAKVYDIRQHNSLNKWGPFMDDGSLRVDWEKVEAILIVLRSNLKQRGFDRSPAFNSIWNNPFAGPWPNSYLPWPTTRESSPLELQDPYGLSGIYLRVVCFLDYTDFFTLNFPPGDQIPNSAPRPRLDVGEATRLILMKIRVTAIEPPGVDDAQHMPVVHFEGISHSLDRSWDENAHSSLRGSVRTTAEHEIRWTTISIFAGHDRWRTEGVQVGGVGSARGVVGNWFDNDHDPHGPCGPTSFWKILDPTSKWEEEDVSADEFLPILDSFGHVDSDDDADQNLASDLHQIETVGD